MLSTCSTSLPSIPTNLGVTPFTFGPALIFIPVEVFQGFVHAIVTTILLIIVFVS